MTAAELTLHSECETRAIAERLAPVLRPGDVLLLEGPIGAGKTYFARCLIQARLAAAGLSEEVPSPTFTLVQTYFDGGCEIWHADLYRLAVPGDVVELGLEEAFEEAICLIEWPDRLGDLAPRDAITLAFDAGPTETGRALRLSGAPERIVRAAAARDVAGA